MLVQDKLKLFLSDIARGSGDEALPRWASELA